MSKLIASSSLQPTHLSLRDMCAEFMRQNKDDFLPFLTDEQTGDILDDGQSQTKLKHTQK